MVETVGKVGAAMILAAGRGTRMAPLTNLMPKPMVPLMGKPLINWALDRVREAGLKHIVVNTHYLAAQIEEHLQYESDIIISHEDTLLETGGGVQNALPLLPGDSFLVCNADNVWLNGNSGSVQRLIDAWDPARMDALLMMQPVENAFGYAGAGDFRMEKDGLLTRRGEDIKAPYVFAGVQILNRSLFSEIEDGCYSLNLLYDKANEVNRLFGLAHDGPWYHIGTVAARDEAEKLMMQD